MYISKLINDISNQQDKKFIIYGTGSGAVKFVSQLNIMFDKIPYFIDSNPIEQFFYNKPVYSVEYLKNISIENIIVIIASSYYEEIKPILLDIGFEENQLLNLYPEKIINRNSEEQIINNIKIGRYTYGYEQHVFEGSTLKSIGSFTSINETALIGSVTNHPLDYVSTHPFLYASIDSGFSQAIFNNPPVNYLTRNLPIEIGNDVWIAANTVILPGVKIGNGSVIAAGAIVTKDVPPYAIVAGVPAKIIKYRFTKDIIEKFEIIKWWDWPLEKIKRYKNDFSDPHNFILKHEFNKYE